MPRLTQAGFGDLVGVEATSIAQLVRRGVLDLTRGADQCILDYCKNLREKAAGRSSDGAHDLTEERARLAHHQANNENLKELERRGDLVSVSEVLATWQDKIAASRAKLLSMPSKLAPAVAISTDTTEVETALRGAIYEALEELAGTGLPAHVEKRLEAIGRGMDATAGPDGEPVGGKPTKAVRRR